MAASGVQLVVPELTWRGWATADARELTRRVLGVASAMGLTVPGPPPPDCTAGACGASCPQVQLAGGPAVCLVSHRLRRPVDSPPVGRAGAGTSPLAATASSTASSPSAGGAGFVRHRYVAAGQSAVCVGPHDAATCVLPFATVLGTGRVPAELVSYLDTLYRVLFSPVSAVLRLGSAAGYLKRCVHGDGVPDDASRLRLADYAASVDIGRVDLALLLDLALLCMHIQREVRPCPGVLYRHHWVLPVVLVELAVLGLRDTSGRIAIPMLPAAWQFAPHRHNVYRALGYRGNDLTEMRKSIMSRLRCVPWNQPPPTWSWRAATMSVRLATAGEIVSHMDGLVRTVNASALACGSLPRIVRQCVRTNGILTLRHYGHEELRVGYPGLAGFPSHDS